MKSQPSRTNFVLVLDDYHVIDSERIDDGLNFLLEHLPPQMHLVISTREDPQFHIGGLRARGRLTELRATDCAFSQMRRPRSSIRRWTWIFRPTKLLHWKPVQKAGLPVFSWQHFRCRGADIPGFIRAFAGDDRYVCGLSGRRGSTTSACMSGAFYYRPPFSIG